MLLKLITRKKENSNTDTWPKRFRAEYIWEGVQDYTNQGIGKVLVRDEVLDKMSSTFIGRPVVNNLHKYLTPENAYKSASMSLEDKADGIVYDAGKADMIVVCTNCGKYIFKR